MGKETRAACVIGWPVEHSRSPLIHNYWLKRHGIAGEYRREAVRPEAFANFVTRLSERGYVGANITLPHKEAALGLSEPDERAKAIGAANTLWREGNRLLSTNTDVEGFLANLDTSAPRWDKGLQQALVLGAGGGARAIVHGLIGRGVKNVHVANRSLARARALRERFGTAVQPLHWEEIGGRLAAAGLLVNATSLGMNGHPPLDLRIEDLPAQAVVADIVYAPLVTPLLAAARKRALRTADGLGMLLHQAVRGFALWFGVTPQVSAELRALVEVDLTK
jgi:shikimate dehydrogenase